MQSILDACQLSSASYAAVSGGDINAAFSIQHERQRYFLKVNEADRYPELFEKESRGLKTLQDTGIIKIPAMIKQGSVNGQSYLLMEWIDSGKRNADAWKRLGRALAAIHLKEQSFFGWTEDNYIGTLIQPNDRYPDWESFFINCRIMPMVKLLVDSGAYGKRELSLIERFCQEVPSLFPKEKPSLLHGDLWSGNFMITLEGAPVLIDPAVYCGHREMDIGMTRLFGGFDPLFYHAYNESYPLVTGWEKRLDFTQLYPLLVHAVLFGGHSIERTRNILALIG